MTRNEKLYDAIRRVVVCYLHPDSGISSDEAFNQIVRIVDTEELARPEPSSVFRLPGTLHH